MRVLWLSLGVTSVALGAVGVVLPLLPTVPFMLLAAFCFARSSDRLHDWLINHPQFGPSIEDWRRSGAIQRRVKWYATASIAAAWLIPFAVGVRPMILTIQAVVLLAVLTFIWTRPEA